MAVDLYKDDFSRLTDAEVFRAVEAFTRISEPIAVRPRESFVLDFKEEWGDRALLTVAGFAHTFGGLLMVGVSEKDAQPDQLVGVESMGELKTSIASSIATNISPTPPYEIAECNVQVGNSPSFGCDRGANSSIARKRLKNRSTFAMKINLCQPMPHNYAR